MNGQRSDLTATQFARQIVADLWDHLPTDDEDKADWQKTFTALLVVFDLSCQRKPCQGYKLIRRAWRTAFVFYNGHVFNPAHDANDRVLFCHRIAIRLLQFIGVYGRLIDGHVGWFLALNDATQRIITYRN